jgi:hypothetical protein
MKGVCERREVKSQKRKVTLFSAFFLLLAPYVYALSLTVGLPQLFSVLGER